MNKLLKEYVESVAGVTLTKEEVLEFLKGLKDHEVHSSLSDQGNGEVSSSTNLGEKASISDVA